MFFLLVRMGDPMRTTVAYGQKIAEFELAERNLLPLRRQSETADGSLEKASQSAFSDQASAISLRDPALAVTEAVESPFHFPPLRRALTPDDHVTIVLDEQLPQLAVLLVP